MPRIERLSLSIVLIPILLISSNSYSSPWIEANDPFLRSSMTALSDASKLSGVTSNFPLRWSSVAGSDALVTVNNHLGTELEHFKYALNTAKLNRGNRRFVMSGGNSELDNGWFSDVSRDKWTVEASYEHLTDSYAFRLNSSYRENDESKETSFTDSYIALNAGHTLFDVGMLPRWWGHGWNHSLILTTSGKDLDAGLSWIGENPLLGVWNLNVVTSKLDKLDYDYRASLRYASKLNSWFELGLTQHYWFEANKQQALKNQKQVAVDVKLTLPEIYSVQHGLYTEMSSAQKDNGLGAYLVGWSGHKSIFDSSLRIVAEYQLMSSEESQSIISDGIDDYLQSSYLNKASWSLSSYLQLVNDHQISAIISTKKLLNDSNEKQEQYQLAYQLPALKGKIKLNIDYINRSTTDSETVFGSKYEFRF
ncbi:capsule assembly Wzi family protein [Vibrio sp. Isolate25]|uniref:capsule assembly Wzi family protein n=1 Tax=Vibrio sp. Isolate25 TaxID=2908535 RepID=UPI001EFDCECB|nr:capsule assembly Wzi family protein [Vibrio sp. Isolate25]